MRFFGLQDGQTPCMSPSFMLRKATMSITIASDDLTLSICPRSASSTYQVLNETLRLLSFRPSSYTCPALNETSCLLSLRSLSLCIQHAITFICPPSCSAHYLHVGTCTIPQSYVDISHANHSSKNSIESCSHIQHASHFSANWHA